MLILGWGVGYSRGSDACVNEFNGKFSIYGLYRYGG